MRECVDEGMLQSYFDGELSGAAARSVAAHLASCLPCAQAARELEQEALLLSQALELEFSAPVPTERLRHKVDAAITGLSLVKPEAELPLAAAPSAAPSVRGWLSSISDLFAFSPQRAFAYSALAAVLLFAAIFGVMRFRQLASNPMETARTKQPAPAPVSSPSRTEEVAVAPKEPIGEPSKRTNPIRPKAKATAPQVVAMAPKAPKTREVMLLPGERSYLKTIARLDSTIKAESNHPMRPGMQAEFERNMALVDRAIAATRSAAKSNPSDPDAAEFMFAAYQSKIDLLNQVADSRLSNGPKP